MVSAWCRRLFPNPPFPLSSHFLALDDISRALAKDAFTFKYLTASLTSFNLLDDVNGSSLSLKFEKKEGDLFIFLEMLKGATQFALTQEGRKRA